MNITEEVANNAAVFAYGKTGNAVISVPFTFRSRSYYFVMIPDSNLFRFLGATVDSSSEVFDDISEVRYIIIPSTTTGKSSIDFTKMTYEEMINHFNLEE